MTGNLAQLTNPVLPANLGSGGISQGGTIIGKLVSSIGGLFFIFAFLLTFLYLLTGGVSWLTSGGDKAKLTEARDKITNAIIGLVIVAAAYAIFALVGQFFGLDVKALKIPSFGG
jgi:hypothetical protein